MLHHARSRTAQRGRVKVPAVLLVITVLGVTAIIAYHVRPGRDRSPFALFHLAPGMSLRQMERSVEAVPGSRVSCRDDADVRHYCILSFSSDPGFMFALVDARDRVIVVQAYATLTHDELPLEVESARNVWNRVALAVSVPPLLADGDTGAVRWTSPDRHWTAEVHYNGLFDPDRPNMVMLVDTRAVAALARTSSHWVFRAREFGWIPPSWQDVSDFEERLR